MIDGQIYGAFNLAYGLGATGLFDMIFSSRWSVNFIFISGPNCGWRGMKPMSLRTGLLNLIQDVRTRCKGMDGVVSFDYWAVGFLFMAVLPLHRG